MLANGDMAKTTNDKTKAMIPSVQLPLTTLCL